MAFDSVSFYWVSKGSVTHVDSHVDGIAEHMLKNLVVNPVYFK